MEVFEHNYRLRIVLEDTNPSPIDTEDSGMAKILYVGEDNQDLFLRIQSWDDDGIHRDFSKIENAILHGANKVRVTIEVS